MSLHLSARSISSYFFFTWTLTHRQKFWNDSRLHSASLLLRNHNLLNAISQIKYRIDSILYMSTWIEMFDGSRFVYNKNFLTEILKKFVAYIFTLLLAPFVVKSVNYSRHSEPFKNAWTLTGFEGKCHLFRFLLIFKSSLMHIEWLNNLDEKDAKKCKFVSCKLM